MPRTKSSGEATHKTKSSAEATHKPKSSADATSKAKNSGEGKYTVFYNIMLGQQLCLHNQLCLNTFT